MTAYIDIDGYIEVRAWPAFECFNEAVDPSLMTDERIESLRDDLIEIDQQQANLQAAADAENRELTDDEVEQMERLFARFNAITEDIERRQTLLANRQMLAQSLGRKSEPQRPDPQNVDDPDLPAQPAAPGARRRQPVITAAESRGSWGFRHFGEFASAVLAGSSRGAQVDPRLIANAPTTYGNEGVGEDGGFMVPPDFKTEIMKKVEGVDSLISRTDQQTTSKNSMTFPTDEVTPWDSTTGVRAYWQDEAAQMNQNKPQLNEEQIRLNKLTCLVPVTEELLEDAPGLGGYLQSKVPQAFDWKLQDAIINGSGAGQFTGILKAAALVSVAKDTVNSPIQSADTFTYRNVVDMWNAMYAPCRRNAVWLVNQDIEPQLDLMQFVPNSNQPIPVYLPPGGASASPYGMLKGRPVIPVEGCQALGDKGDVILADLSKYMTIMKTGGIRQDVSIHLYFDYDVTAFRFIFRIGGKPWWGSSITLPNSSTARSCFVTLDERA